MVELVEKYIQYKKKVCRGRIGGEIYLAQKKVSRGRIGREIYSVQKRCAGVELVEKYS